MNEMMVDIESLGLENNSVMLSVGWCVFSKTHGVSLKSVDGCRINVASELLLGAVIDEDTVSWWNNQSHEARQQIDRGMTVSTDFAMMHLRDEFIENRCQTVWAKGPQFDIENIKWHMDKVDIEAPWTHSQVRDSRTLLKTTRLLHPDMNDLVFGGTQHVAQDDAVFQALEVLECYKWLKD